VAWANELATFAPLTLAYNKRILNGWADDDEIAERYAEIWTSADAAEAAQAWREKRRPTFFGH
jgi:enoyl-CoA hydratase